MLASNFKFMINPNFLSVLLRGKTWLRSEEANEIARVFNANLETNFTYVEWFDLSDGSASF
jgi:hypothetical protein